MSNLENWDKLARPPKDALKSITGGRLKGMTDINPQWRYKAMTEVYGPCGNGWAYEVVRLWTEPGTDGQVFAFAHVNLHVGQNAPIPGIGGSMLLEKDKYGLHHNDEAYKMAITDALSVAMKMLGVGADIYMGRWDGSKYQEPTQQGKGVIKPTDGAWEAMDEETQNWMLSEALVVAQLVADGDVEGACRHIDSLGMENEYKVAFWTRLDSKQRSALKKQWELMKAAA